MGKDSIWKDNTQGGGCFNRKEAEANSENAPPGRSARSPGQGKEFLL